MNSWFLVCLVLALCSQFVPSLAHQMAPAAFCLVLLPLVVLFNTAELKRVAVQMLSGPVFLAAVLLMEGKFSLSFGTLAPLAVASVFCLANAMSPPPYTLGRFLSQMTYFGFSTAVYVSRGYWSSEAGLAFCLGIALALLASRTLKSFQAAPGGCLGDIPIGTENDKQTGLFVAYLFSSFFSGLLCHLALGFPSDWTFNSVLFGATISSALYVRVLLVSGLHAGPADRLGGHPGPRFPEVSQIPWKSYGLALPWLLPGLCVPFRSYESETLLMIRVSLFLVGLFFLFRPVLVQRPSLR